MGNKEKGLILNIQHFSLDDGPGIRTSVFFKGCNMVCAWCHNPESICGVPELMYSADKCIGCGACVRECPNNACVLVGSIAVINRDMCKVCGRCAETCFNGALSLAGRWASVDEIIGDVRRDKRYFDSSGGGMTLTGGEPMCQSDFVLELAHHAKECGINVAMETNGSAPYEKYRRVLPYIDLFLIDYKLTDRVSHIKYTGIDNDAIINNIYKLCEEGANVVLRCPVIPGINDNEEHFKAIAKLSCIAETMMGFEVMPYHKLGASKSKRLGGSMEMFEVPDTKTVKEWEEKIIRFGGKVWERS